MPRYRVFQEVDRGGDGYRHFRQIENVAEVEGTWESDDPPAAIALARAAVYDAKGSFFAVPESEFHVEVYPEPERPAESGIAPDYADSAE